MICSHSSCCILSRQIFTNTDSKIYRLGAKNFGKGYCQKVKNSANLVTLRMLVIHNACLDCCPTNSQYEGSSQGRSGLKSNMLWASVWLEFLVWWTLDLVCMHFSRHFNINFKKSDLRQVADSHPVTQRQVCYKDKLRQPAMKWTTSAENLSNNLKINIRRFFI